ncbi:MAG: hypothetical protein BAJALOKI1v1_390018 [Promethearchaeota archaeon]|nr:MAG: hypothetical protein BAJALOKI1v1_390018 [Candidatus Lokiarchaeota archaeon]
MITCKTIVERFGAQSTIFEKAYKYLLKMSITHEQLFENQFKKWHDYFSIIYGNDATRNLFLMHTYYTHLLKALLIMNKFERIHRFNKTDPSNPHGKKYKNDSSNKNNEKSRLHEFTASENNYELFLNYFYSCNLLEFGLFEFELFNWISLDSDLLICIYEEISSHVFQAQDLFHLLYQNIFYQSTRHKLGEFYTPPSLVRKMITRSYQFGDKTLDPSCGSGNFIMELIQQIFRTEYPLNEKIKAIKNIYGFDINPLATYTAKINLLLLLNRVLSSSSQSVSSIFIEKDYTSAILLVDSLCCELLTDDYCQKEIQQLFNSFDLAIGNPPWLTYKDAGKNVRIHLKKLSAYYDIKPLAQNITNIEQAIIFLYRIPDIFLNRSGNAKISFVMPKSLLVSSQNQKARRFESFKNIVVFEFNNLLFNIDFCCVFANYVAGNGKRESIINKYPIKGELYDIKTMNLLEEYTLEPYVYFELKQGDKYLVKKLIKSNEINALFPCTLSNYYNKFIQGADLLPKSLLYVEIIDEAQKGDIVFIDPWISPQAKGAWKKPFFSNVQVEKQHLFKATLSRGLYPYFISLFHVFLPLDNILRYKPDNLAPLSKKHWIKIKNVYQNQKGKDLFDWGINYRNKLCTNGEVRKSQRYPYKVVFPNAKTLMAAVIEDPSSEIFIDSTLYYYGTDNKDEAYYICGMLNIPKLYESVKAISDTRHHHKRPLYFNIPKFINLQEQQKIAHLAQKCSKLIKKRFLNTKKDLTLSTIKKVIKNPQQEINRMGTQILNSAEKIIIIREYLLS